VRRTSAFSRKWLLAPVLGASVAAGVAVSCATTKPGGKDETSMDRAAAEKNGIKSGEPHFLTALRNIPYASGYFTS